MALSNAGSPAAASSFLQDAFHMASQRMDAFQSILQAMGMAHGGKNLTAVIEQVIFTP